jgi:hypothetical protein
MLYTCCNGTKEAMFKEPPCPLPLPCPPLPPGPAHPQGPHTLPPPQLAVRVLSQCADLPVCCGSKPSPSCAALRYRADPGHASGFTPPPRLVPTPPPHLLCISCPGVLICQYVVAHNSQPPGFRQGHARCQRTHTRSGLLWATTHRTCSNKPHTPCPSPPPS